MGLSEPCQDSLLSLNTLKTYFATSHGLLQIHTFSAKVRTFFVISVRENYISVLTSGLYLSLPRIFEHKTIINNDLRCFNLHFKVSCCQNKVWNQVFRGYKLCLLVHIHSCTILLILESNWMQNSQSKPLLTRLRGTYSTVMFPVSYTVLLPPLCFSCVKWVPRTTTNLKQRCNVGWVPS